MADRIVVLKDGVAEQVSTPLARCTSSRAMRSWRALSGRQR
ncbi:hypothetical protein [Variovorax rhizosphaerae]